jgi:serine/threonine protein kinase/Tfp pilus assembly protein PilF
VIPTLREPSHSLIGRSIGSIQVTELLGAGGMGEVYRGFDAKLERQVAVKTIRADHRLEPEIKARFLREARILSRIDHPAICQVYDLIEGDEADYLIFELVGGKTLKSYAAERRLEPAEVLALGEKIAEALAAAHRERIVHRDLKPENVMVLPDGSIKILDFGISRGIKELGDDAEPAPVPPLATPATPPAEEMDAPAATEPLSPLATVALTSARETSATGSGRATAVTLDADLTTRGFVVGTLRYMSPEQARGEAVVEASDLYSLGIVFQELLTGQPAYRATGAALLEEVALGRTLPIAGVDPDVAALVERLKGLAPAWRPTAVETAERIRFLLGKPARLRAQRLRRQLAAGAFALLLLVLAVVSVLAIKARREAQRANTEAERANAEAQRARQVADFVVALFREASPDATHGENVTPLEMVDRGARQLREKFRDQPAIRAGFEDAVGAIYWRLSRLQEARRLLDSALQTRLAVLGEGTLEVAVSRTRLANVLSDLGELEQAEALLRQAIATFESRQPTPRADLAEALNSLGFALFQGGDAEAAKPLFVRALALQEAASGPESEEVAELLNNLAIVAWQEQDFAAAEGYYTRSLAIKERQGPGDPDLAALLNNLGILYREQGKLDEAGPLHERALAIAEKALGPEHPEVALVLYSLGKLRAAQGRNGDAAALLERAYAINRARLGAEHFETGRALMQLGEVLRRQGENERAGSLLAQACAILDQAVGTDHPTAQECHAFMPRS